VFQSGVRYSDKDDIDFIHDYSSNHDDNDCNHNSNKTVQVRVHSTCTVPVMTVALPLEHDMRHVNIVAAAFASLSDSELHCIRRCGIKKDIIRL
jgi:hypothetical protein